MTWKIHHHDVTVTPWPIADESVQCCVTSPPYWGLRDYGVAGQLGLERTPAEYVEKIVAVFREVRRVLRKDGTVWLNLGDSYAGSWGAQSRPDGNDWRPRLQGGSMLSARQIKAHPNRPLTGSTKRTPGLKRKDMIGIPWRTAFALQDDGWWLRRDIVWWKPNPMRESVLDRPTSSHEYIFIFSKSARYFYDQEAVRTDDVGSDHKRTILDGQPSLEPTGGLHAPHSGIRTIDGRNGKGANAVSVWRIATQPYRGAHFATFPAELPRRCILAGTREGDTVLDPFMGSGTVALVADTLGRNSVGLELNPEYIELAEKRIRAPRTEAEKARRDQEDAGQANMFTQTPVADAIAAQVSPGSGTERPMHSEFGGYEL